MALCNLCPRSCNVDRSLKLGFCGVLDKIKIAKADLHYWEEPCISGEKGSGTIFFSGCSLGCVFCQNNALSHKKFGKEISDQRLYDIFFELKRKGANNINLVTADHYIDRIIPIISKAKSDGIAIPFILNTSSYLKSETIEKLKDIIDIYIADFKFYSPDISKKYANAPNYSQIAKKAIETMYNQVGKCVFTDGLLNKGVIVRLLVLPNNIIDAKLIIKYILDKYSDNVCFSIMNQFTPINCSEFAELNCKLSDREYKSVIDFAYKHNLTNGFIQGYGSATENYIPNFDLKGV